MPLDPEDIFDKGEELITPIVSDVFGKLTNTAEVRAVFGLSEAELPDELLTRKVYIHELDSVISSLVPALVGRWATLVVSLEPKDIMVVNATKHLSTYAVAQKICDILPILTARSLTDSKASFQRFDLDLDSVIDSVDKSFAKAKANLLGSLEEEAGVKVVTSLFFMGARPSFDPITGEGGGT